MSTQPDLRKRNNRVTLALIAIKLWESVELSDKELDEILKRLYCKSVILNEKVLKRFYNETII